MAAVVTYPVNHRAWPWPLRSVSFTWRAVALAMPELWYAHNINLGHHSAYDTTIPFFKHVIPSQGMLSLDLNGPASPEIAAYAINELLLPNLPRIQRLHLNYFPASALKGLLDAPAGELINLVDFRLDVTDADHLFPGGDTLLKLESTSMISQAMNLQRLSLSGYQVRDLDLNFDDLISLDLSGGGLITLFAANRLLKECGSLRTASFSLSGDRERYSQPSDDPEVIAPHLQNLTLMGVIPKRLTMLRIPWEALETLDLRSAQRLKASLAISILQRCHLLGSLSATIDDKFKATDQRPGMASLLHLQKLDLELTSGNIFSSVIAPALTDLTLCCESMPVKPLLTLISQSSCQILDFRHKSREEEHLPRPIHPERARQLFEAMPMLRSFTSHCPLKGALFDRISPGRPTSLKPERPLLPNLFELDCVVTPRDFGQFLGMVEARAWRGLNAPSTSIFNTLCVVDVHMRVDNVDEVGAQFKHHQEQLQALRAMEQKRILVWNLSFGNSRKESVVSYHEDEQ
ncbi:hypothetical protein DXG03_002517 [Asterophora parasitica]|uniref:Uncharacterized protein n=1 Tax=Asterophora parasitica TaxID=117018 RepID=A0A9P7G2V3_9AGAR|nr:hypothetical protein DXG03_002517 [Asterophora parasitica]